MDSKEVLKRSGYSLEEAMEESAAKVFNAGEEFFFHVGDVVRLRSGGPAMTVTDVWNKDSIHCVWFANEVVMGENLPSAALEVVPKSGEKR
jgi:uncharacterized protein YodC (DUF2158 family)